MARLKVEDDVDLEELENAEYNEDGSGDYHPYDGPLPPKETLLRGNIKKMWYGYTANDDAKLIVLFIADGNLGSKAKYEGLPIWEHIALTPGAKFRWFPFLSSIGLTIQDAVKRCHTSGDADNIGDPIEKIGKWEPGDNDEAYVNVLTAREKYQGEWQTRVGKFMPWTEPQDDSAEAEEPEDVDEGDEPDSEEPKTTRGRSARAAANATGNGKAATGGRSARGRSEDSSKASAGRSRGRGRAKADEDPPF